MNKKEDLSEKISADTLKFFEGVPDDQFSAIENLLGSAISQESGVLTATQVKEMVPIDNWVNYTYFLGSLAKDLYPYWKEALPRYINSKKPELILSGSIGAGKTTFAFVCWLRKLYELSCYDFPQRLFGLSDMTDIVFAYLSINMTHAERVGFGQFRSMVDSIPYFRKEFPRDRTFKSVLKFPQRIAILPGSDNLSVISTNLFGCIMDEADFYRRGGSGAATVGDANKASKIYREVTDRRMSRFMMKGYDPGFSAIISSASIQSSFVSSRIRQATQYNTATIYITTLWDVKPGNYSEERFYVFKGTEKEDAFLIESVNDLITMGSDSVRIKVLETRDKLVAAGVDINTDVAISRVMSELPLKFVDNFISVPKDFKQNFRDDIYGALRNIGGVSISPSGKLFSSKFAWQKCISSDIQHPFTKETFTISLKTQQHLSDYFKPDILFNETIEEGRKVYRGLKRHPEALRYAHLDYATTGDTLGLAIVHISEMIEDPNTLLRIPKIETDIVLSIIAPKNPDRISFAKIREFFFMLRLMGMRFGKITLDQFQSEDTIQIFTANQFNAARRSVDKDDSAYLLAVDLIYEDRLVMYTYSILEREWFNLNHFTDAKKVDHPDVNEDGSKGDKGVSDALVGSIANAVEAEPSYVTARTNSEVVNDIVFTIGMRPEEKKDESWLVPANYSKDGRKLKLVRVLDDTERNGIDYGLFSSI
jgi:hypothetical protein